MYNKYHDQGFTILAVNAWDEDEQTLRRFVGENKLPYPVLLKGGALRKDWGVRYIPANFLVSREGKIVKKSVGFDDREAEHLEKAIKEQL